jgi:hypothetical protein
MLAWVICLVCWPLLTLGLLLWTGSNSDPTPTSGLQTGQGGLAIAIMYTLTWLEVSVVGALIAARQPTNPIGWLIEASSLLAALQGLANGYAAYAHAAADAGMGLPGREALAWVGSWVGPLALGLVVVVLLVFPTGRFLFPWSRLVAWLAVVGSVF